MIFAIEEIIVPKPQHLAFVNFSRKSYMFTYVKQTGYANYVFADGSPWLGTQSTGPLYLKQRGFVTL